MTTGAQASVLLSLAACCEKATGPDTDLFLAIEEATGLVFERNPTASLDAAMSLVPEGWGWVKLDLHPFGNEASCVQTGGKLYSRHSGKCSAPALALCAAALRARASELGK